MTSAPTSVVLYLTKIYVHNFTKEEFMAACVELDDVDKKHAWDDFCEANNLTGAYGDNHIKEQAEETETMDAADVAAHLHELSMWGHEHAAAALNERTEH